MMVTGQMWRAKGYVVHPESYYSSIYEGTTDTGESSPIWSVRFMERRPKEMLEVISGEATYTAQRRTTTRHEYRVHAATKARLLENTLYFPGWKVLVDGKQVPLEFQDPEHRGLMTFWIEPGSHEIIVRFDESAIRMVADMVSLVGLIMLGASYMYVPVL